MIAVGYRQARIIGRKALVDIDLPMPEPGPRHLLVEIRAVSINPVDIKIRGRS